MMTQAKKEKNEAEVSEREKELEAVLQLLQDRSNLKEEGYFRQQILVLMERIAKALEDSLIEEKEEKNE